MYFPAEVVEKILINLDVHSLMKAKRVCKDWNHIVVQMEKSTYMWLDFCMMDIPGHVLNDITAIQDIASTSTILYHLLSKLGPVFWKEVYKEHARSRRIRRETYKITTVNCAKEMGSVTALTFYNLTLYSGFENGIVYRWNNVDGCPNYDGIPGSNHLPVQKITCNPKGVSVTDLLNSKTEEVLFIVYEDLIRMLQKTSCNWEEKSQFPRLHRSRKEEITFLRSGTLYSENRYAWYSGRSLWTTEEFSNVRQPVGVTTTNRITATEVKDNYILIGTENGRLYCHSLTDELHNAVPCELLDVNFGIMIKSIIVKGSCILCLTGDSALHISVKNSPFRRLDTQSVFGCEVEYIAWKGCILVIGTKYGFIYVYHIKQDKDMLYFELRKSTKIKFDADHINAVAIGDDGLHPVVAVGTDRVGVVYVIRW